MTVCVLGLANDPDRWADTAARAIAAAGGVARLILVGDTDQDHDDRRIEVNASASDASIRVAGEIVPETLILLASAKVPLELIAAAFATPAGQTSRKIVDIENAGAADARVLSLFEIADMLIFTPTAIAAALELPSAPTDVRELLGVQPHLVRHNQAAVVRFAGKGGSALWADRTMFVTTNDAADPAGAAARLSGTIAAAVAQKIGPEPAMKMALAAAAAETETLKGPA